MMVAWLCTQVCKALKEHFALASGHWFATGLVLVLTGGGGSSPSCVIAAVSNLDEDLIERRDRNSRN
jgi:hypothetical protein